MTARVSVIIPVFNAADYIAEAIESVIAQTLPVCETIVVDDGSTDDSAAVAARYDVTLLRQENRGVADARNLAIGRAAGDYFALLDADDVWPATKIENQVNALADHPEAGLALGFQSYIFEGSAPAEWFLRTRVEDSEPGYSPSVWMIPRTTWERVGIFEPGRRIGEDIDWLARAFDMGITYHMVPRVLLRRRIHDRNLTGLPETRQAWLRVLRASAARKRAIGRP